MKDKIIETCRAAEIIYCAGGSALVVVPASEDADRIITAVEALYRSETMTASITAAKWKLDAIGKEGGFGKEVREVSYILRERKEHKAPELYLPIEGSLQPCPSCGQHPISERDEATDDPVCYACAIKRRYGRLEARSFHWEGFLEVAGPTWTNVQHARELEDVGKASRPANYIGLIYGDGNNMGQQLWKRKTKEEFWNFADAIEKLVRETVFTALSKLQSRPVAPFEIFLMGGDDFVLAVPGHNALDVALTIAENIEAGSEILQERYDDFRLSVGIGVVIAHQKFPLEMMFNLALELQKRAKRKSFEERNASAIDFMVISAPSTRGVTALREQVYTERAFRTSPRVMAAKHNDQDQPEFRLTRRPYTVSNLQKLLEQARKMRRGGFPQGRLHTLEAALFTSEATAMREAQTALGRGRVEHRKLLDNFFREFEGIQGENSGVPPWSREKDYRGKDYYGSALADLAEIYPFVR